MSIIEYQQQENRRKICKNDYFSLFLQNDKDNKIYNGITSLTCRMYA